MLSMIKSFLSNDLAIDLGTENCLIYVREEGIKLNEPSIVAISGEYGSKHIIAYGENAKKMLGRTPRGLEAIRPLEKGVIVNFGATEKMIENFINKVYEKKFFRPNPRVLLSVPSSASEVERRALEEAVIEAGAREVHLMESVMAAAIGAGLPVSSEKASMIIDLGAGTTEVGILSLNGIVVSKSIEVGGGDFDEAIISYLRKNKGVLIGYETAEKIKCSLGTAIFNEEEDVETSINIKGRDLKLGTPIKTEVFKKEVYLAMYESLVKILEGIIELLEKVPPEISADLFEKGIVLSGGGARIENLDKLIEEATNLSVKISEDPLKNNINGCGMALELINNPNRFMFLD